MSQPQPQPPRMRNTQESTPDLVYNIDQLEYLVSSGKRVPMSRMVIVDEDEFMGLLDDIRANIPMEIRDAQRLLKERERIVGEAQEEALRIVNDAQRRAQVLVGEHTIMAEAKQHAEELLRQAEKARQEEKGRMQVYFLQQIAAIRAAAITTMGTMEATVERSLDALDDAQAAIEQDDGPQH
ncbi:MAG: ATP synthase F0 subunit B [Thermomicrobiales bacterium]|nr:ATP synthase F0 subunit B [Thermomicrobiales bacterium]MCO5217652.1 ATP synthase F0 subunit B [Thermomicrobiales bacterium]MCO5228161.1 ATP synthase F0 subunit B [Thermomicrobiales bacterium]